MVSKNTDKILDSLFTLATDNLRFHRRAKLAAAIVYKSDIIAYGFNDIKTHPLQLKFGKNEFSYHLHAEICAIKNSLKRTNVDTLANCTLYVVRSKIINGYDVYGSAKPCLGCSKAISAFGIHKVIYTLDNPNDDGLMYNTLYF